MGDRANVIFTTKKAVTGKGQDRLLKGNIVLYSHWGGCELATNVRKALAKAEGRWSDAGYATRIIVSRLVGDEWADTTGFGLYVGELGDNSHNFVVVDFAVQCIRITTSDAVQLFSTSFQQYLLTSDSDINAIYLGE
jgi:hypothetical protein